MSSVNRVTLVGHLGADPELRHTSSGSEVCELRLATGESWMKDGEKKERTEWHRVIVWGKTAVACAKYLAKGGQIYVEGKIRSRTYDDKEGVKRYITEVIANDVVFLGKSSKGERHPDEEFAPSIPGPDSDIPF